MGFGEGLGDRESDPGAAVAAVAGDVGAVEPFEHVRQVLGGDALAAVGDRDGELAVVRRRGDLDVAVRRRVAQRVVEKVAQHLREALRICPHLGQHGRNIGGQRHALRCVAVGDRGQRGRDRRLGVDPRRRDRAVALFGLGERSDVIGEAHEPSGSDREAS